MTFVMGMNFFNVLKPVILSSYDIWDNEGFLV